MSVSPSRIQQTADAEVVNKLAAMTSNSPSDNNNSKRPDSASISLIKYITKYAPSKAADERLAITRQKKAETERVFFDHCSSTEKAEYSYYATMNEPAASPLHSVRARETVFRNYVEKDRNLDFGFIVQDFFDGREQMELAEEERKEREQIQNEALADGDEKLADLLGKGSEAANIKTRIRACHAEEHCERSKIFWNWQKSLKGFKDELNKEYLVHHHKETIRVNDENREKFFGRPQPIASFSQQQQHQQQQQSQEEEHVDRRDKSVSVPRSVVSSSSPPANNKVTASTTTAAPDHTAVIFPFFAEVDFTFLVEYESKMRQLIERTALQELRGAERAYRAFQIEALNNIDILRLKKSETLKRAYIAGWYFRFQVLMLQEKETARRKDLVGLEELQLRTQIDVVENRCWLKAKESETWRKDRDRTFEVAEERKQRERQWQKNRLDEEEMKKFIRHELETRIELSREEHYSRSIIQEQHDREHQVLRKREIISIVEQQVSANTLHWTEQFHAQVVVMERQKRRQLLAEEADHRNELLSDEVRDYIQTRRDELFDKDTADAMKHIDQIRAKDGEVTAATLPIRLPKPPAVSYSRATTTTTKSLNENSRSDSSSLHSTTGASLRAPRVQ